MKLTWHIVMKDLRRFRWFIAVLATVMGTKIGIGVWAMNSTLGGAEFNRIWEGSGQGTGLVLVVLEVVLSYLFVAAAVQEDPLVGRGMEWRTRPISGARLLGAKTLTIGLVVAVMPVLIALPWWVACGFGAGELVRAIGTTVTLQLVIALMALPLAVLTDGYARFLLWTVMLWFGVSSILSLPSTFAGAKLSPELDATRSALALAVAAVVAVGVGVHQFLTLHTKRGIGLIAGAVVVNLVVLSFWPWAFVASDVGPKTAAGNGIGVVVGETRFQPTRGDNRTVVTGFRVQGIPVGYRVQATKVQQVWTWSDGAQYERSGLRFRQRLLPETAGVSPATTTGGGFDRVLFGRTEIQVPMTTAERLETERPALRAVVNLHLSREIEEPALPLKLGEEHRVADGMTRIIGVERTGDELHVNLVAWRSMAKTGKRVFFMFGNGMSFLTFRLVDADGTRSLSGRAKWNTFGVAEVEIQRIEVKFDLTSSGAEEWLGNASLWSSSRLIRTEYVPTERFERVATQGEIQIDRDGGMKR